MIIVYRLLFTAKVVPFILGDKMSELTLYSYSLLNALAPIAVEILF